MNKHIKKMPPASYIYSLVTVSAISCSKESSLGESEFFYSENAEGDKATFIWMLVDSSDPSGESTCWYKHEIKGKDKVEKFRNYKSFTELEESFKQSSKITDKFVDMPTLSRGLASVGESDFVDKNVKPFTKNFSGVWKHVQTAIGHFCEGVYMYINPYNHGYGGGYPYGQYGSPYGYPQYPNPYGQPVTYNTPTEYISGGSNYSMGSVPNFNFLDSIAKGLGSAASGTGGAVGSVGNAAAALGGSVLNNVGHVISAIGTGGQCLSSPGVSCAGAVIRNLGSVAHNIPKLREIVHKGCAVAGAIQTVQSTFNMTNSDFETAVNNIPDSALSNIAQGELASFLELLGGGSGGTQSQQYQPNPQQYQPNPYGGTDTPPKTSQQSQQQQQAQQYYVQQKQAERQQASRDLISLVQAERNMWSERKNLPTSYIRRFESGARWAGEQSKLKKCPKASEAVEIMAGAFSYGVDGRELTPRETREQVLPSPAPNQNQAGQNTENSGSFESGIPSIEELMKGLL